jgi:hypothetical protein
MEIPGLLSQQPIANASEALMKYVANYSMLEITVTCPCGVNCKFCPQGAFYKAYNGRRMLSLEDFKLAVDKLPQYVIVAFAGFAEPFLNPKAIDMIEYAAQQKHRVFLYSTLVGLRVEDVKRLAKCPLHFFVVHLPDNLGNTPIAITQQWKDVLAEVLMSFRIDDFSVHNQRWMEGKPLSNQTYARDGGRAGLLPTGLKEPFTGEFFCRKLVAPQFVLLPNLDCVLCCNDFGLRHRIGNMRQVASWDKLCHSKEYRRVQMEAIGRVHTGSRFIICRFCKDVQHS